MTGKEAAYEVVHEPEESRFAVHTEGLTAVLEYQRVGERVVMPHTVVPAPLEGRGVGSRLARTALDWARDENLRVVPLCPFVRAYILRHPEYAALTTRPEAP
jgi:predicted GNAT family acetyltransferase